MNTSNLDVPTALVDETKALTYSIVDQARKLTVDSDEAYAQAGDFLTSVIKPALKQLDEAFDPIVKSWHSGHKQTLATKKGLAAPLLKAETLIKGALGSWVRAKEQERRALEAKYKREAEARAIEEAARLAETGDEAGAEEVLAGLGEVSASVPTVVARNPEADGVSVRKVKKWRLVDKGRLKMEFLVVDEATIGRLVRTLGEGAVGVVTGEGGEGVGPAIEVYEEVSIGAGTRGGG